MISSIDNKRIAKNTIFLYCRMFITMAIGLYTSRIVLQTLGIDDYGVYNIVGGVVVLFSFISNALRNATQRFLSFELGKIQNSNPQKVLNMSILCHILICLLLFVLAETIGLWFTCTQLNIPENRVDIILYVYQLSVLTFSFHVMQVPFSSLIISHERMSFYAYISILESILKLGMVYFLLILPGDKLIIYSSLIAIIAFLIMMTYALYCVESLGYNKIYLCTDKSLFKSLMSFSGWSMANGCATLFTQQGGNYLINIFSGVAANAAYGIANQVSNLIYGFVANFQSAFQPQIVKQYASNNTIILNSLIFRTSTMSYYLLLIIAIPFTFESDYLLKLWLGIVPQYTNIFCILLLIYFLIDSIQAPIWMLIYGTGRIKQYTIVTGLLTLLNLPFSWYFLFERYPLYYIFVVKIVVNIVCCIYRMIYVHINLNFSSLEYVRNVFVRTILLTIVVLSLCYMLNFIGLHSILNILISILICTISVLTFGFNKNDRVAIISLISSKVKR